MVGLMTAFSLISQEDVIISNNKKFLQFNEQLFDRFQLSLNPNDRIRTHIAIITTSTSDMIIY